LWADIRLTSVAKLHMANLGTYAVFRKERRGKRDSAHLKNGGCPSYWFYVSYVSHHPDRGRQYASYAYQELLRQYSITPSMSRSGNCYDNAYVESFFGTLKTELVHGERYRSRLEARLTIFEYVKVLYNRQRRHSVLGHRSPEQYEKLLNQT